MWIASRVSCLVRAPTSESLNLESSFLAGTSSDYLGQVHISRSFAKDSATGANNRICECN